MAIEAYLKRQAQKINQALTQCLPKATEYPQVLHEAMRYAVLFGGKRIRPILALASCEAVGGDTRNVLSAACALELVHNYSLVHDDLPCMDDDDLRRGQPTCHKKFGEDVAVLTGDALLTLAFKVMNHDGGRLSASDAKKRLTAGSWIAEAIGSRGMVGGQAVDMQYQKEEPDLPTIEYINTQKSGALIAVSTRVGGYLGGGTPKEVAHLYQYGKYAGLLFQIVDDILDQEGYAKVIGIHEAKKEAENLLSKALSELKHLGPKKRVLEEIALFILKRDH